MIKDLSNRKFLEILIVSRSPLRTNVSDIPHGYMRMCVYVCVSACV